MARLSFRARLALVAAAAVGLAVVVAAVRNARTLYQRGAGIPTPLGRLGMRKLFVLALVLAVSLATGVSLAAGRSREIAVDAAFFTVNGVISVAFFRWALVDAVA